MATFGHPWSRWKRRTSSARRGGAGSAGARRKHGRYPALAPAEEIRRQLTFALVGGGTVGVEMAGTLAEMSRMALTWDFRYIDLRSARILLFEAGPRILATYPEDLSLDAHRHLEGLGVEVYTNARVTQSIAKGSLL